MRTNLLIRDPWFASNADRNFFSPWDKAFDQFFNHLPVASETKFTPAVDVREDKNNYLLSFDVPGVDKKDVSIEVKDNYLTISGERKHVHDESKNDLRIVERSYGKFTRTFELPEGIDAEKIEASHKDGVLLISVPKVEAKKAKQITINSDQGFFQRLLARKSDRDEKEVS